MKILIIEDEFEIVQSIKEFLHLENFSVEALTYQSGLEKVLNYDYDCVLLDIMLPGDPFMLLDIHLRYRLTRVTGTIRALLT